MWLASFLYFLSPNYIIYHHNQDSGLPTQEVSQQNEVIKVFHHYSACRSHLSLYSDSSLCQRMTSFLRPAAIRPSYKSRKTEDKEFFFTELHYQCCWLHQASFHQVLRELIVSLISPDLNVSTVAFLCVLCFCL